MAAYFEARSELGQLRDFMLGPSGVEPADPNGQGAQVVAGDPAGATGTKHNPLPPDVTFLLADWEITLGLSDLDAAGQLLDFDEWNSNRIEAGDTAVLVPVQVKYVGEASGTVWQLDFTYVTLDGNTYSTRNACGHIPDDLHGAGEMFTGAINRGNVCATLPAGAMAEGGVWMVQSPVLAWEQARAAGTPRLRVFVNAHGQ